MNLTLSGVIRFSAITHEIKLHKRVSVKSKILRNLSYSTH